MYYNFRKLIDRCNEKLWNFWNGLLKTEESEIIPKLKKLRIFWLVSICIMVFLSGTILFKSPGWHYTSRIMLVLYLLCFLEATGLFIAVKKGKEARHSYIRKAKIVIIFITCFITFLIFFSVIVTQNSFGIGETIKETLSWSTPVAEAVFEYINGMATELFTF